LPTLTTVVTPSFLEKCLIYWHTKDYGKKMEHIALLLSVAIYMNSNIYEEELKSAEKHLFSLLKDKDDVKNVMEYIKMTLASFQDDNEIWLKSRQEAFDLVVKDEDLYRFMIDVFHSDDSFSENEQLFEATLKRLI